MWKSRTLCSIVFSSALNSSCRNKKVIDASSKIRTSSFNSLRSEKGKRYWVAIWLNNSCNCFFRAFDFGLVKMKTVAVRGNVEKQASDVALLFNLFTQRPNYLCFEKVALKKWPLYFAVGRPDNRTAQVVGRLVSGSCSKATLTWFCAAVFSLKPPDRVLPSSIRTGGSKLAQPRLGLLFKWLGWLYRMRLRFTFFFFSSHWLPYRLGKQGFFLVTFVTTAESLGALPRPMQLNAPGADKGRFIHSPRSNWLPICLLPSSYVLSTHWRGN